MILQLEGHQRGDYGQYFDAMFRQRKIVFHDQNKWDVKVTDGVYEIDEYDRDDTCYLLSLDDRGQLVGSARLLSTTTPNMLAGPFQEMFPGLSFCSPLIWEVTRFGIYNDTRIQINKVSTAACELILGFVQFALQNGISHVTGISEAKVCRVYKRCRFDYIELDRRKLMGGETVIAGLVPISKQMEQNIIAATGLYGNDVARPRRRAA